MTDLCDLTIAELGAWIGARDVSPTEVVEAHLARIEAVDGRVHAFISVLADSALAAARDAERAIAAGDRRGPLQGVPIAVKDLFYTRGHATTFGSRVFADFIPAFDAAPWARLAERGAVLLGKTNLVQFGFGPLGDNPDFGDVANPWDLARVTGGSSSGSAAAVAAREAPAALGSDTGGSVRLPAALCGVVGLKPTFGLFSRYGVAPAAWSLDHPGTLTRTVEDCAILTEALAGHDPRDAGSSKVALGPLGPGTDESLEGLVVGVADDWWGVDVDPEVDALVRAAVEQLADLGATVVEMPWPLYEQAQLVSAVLIPVEAAARWGDVVRDRGDEIDQKVRHRIESGFFITGVEYVHAQRVREGFRRAAGEAFAAVDVVAGPAVPASACHYGTTHLRIGAEELDVLATYTEFGRPYNLTGFPALTVPCGFTAAGLPVGLQLGARAFGEPTLFRVGHAYQAATSWHEQAPDAGASVA